MTLAETRPGQGCKETATIAEQLRVSFENIAARKHLVECTSCRDTLEKIEEGNLEISTLVRSIRNGLACAG